MCETMYIKSDINYHVFQESGNGSKPTETKGLVLSSCLSFKTSNTTYVDSRPSAKKS